MEQANREGSKTLEETESPESISHYVLERIFLPRRTSGSYGSGYKDSPAHNARKLAGLLQDGFHINQRGCFVVCWGCCGLKRS